MVFCTKNKVMRMSICWQSSFLVICPFDYEGKNVSVPFSEQLKSHTAQSHLLGGGLKLSLKCDFCVFNHPILRVMCEIFSLTAVGSNDVNRDVILHEAAWWHSTVSAQEVLLEKNYKTNDLNISHFFTLLALENQYLTFPPLFSILYTILYH